MLFTFVCSKRSACCAFFLAMDAACASQEGRAGSNTGDCGSSLQLEEARATSRCLGDRDRIFTVLAATLLWRASSDWSALRLKLRLVPCRLSSCVVICRLTSNSSPRLLSSCVVCRLSNCPGTGGKLTGLTGHRSPSTTDTCGSGLWKLNRISESHLISSPHLQRKTNCDTIAARKTTRMRWKVPFN